MKYYFAATFSRLAEMRAYRDELRAVIPVAEVTSRWIDLQTNGNHAEAYTPAFLAAQPETGWANAEMDLEDLIAADAIVSFTGEPTYRKPSQGGRHIEHGVAIAYSNSFQNQWSDRYRLILVGPRENVFHCHPRTEVYKDWQAFLFAEMRRTIEKHRGRKDLEPFDHTTEALQ